MPDQRHVHISRALATEAALMLMVADRGVRWLGFRRLARTLRVRERSRQFDPSLVTRVVAALDSRGDEVRYSCLRRGFAAAWMLQLRGYGPVLHYGVRRDDGEMRAHVWVDVSGHPVVGQDQAEGYALLASFPAASRSRG